MNIGKCPHCKEPISRVTIDAIGIPGANETILAGNAYICPHCSCVLSVSLDPLSIQRETIAEIQRKISPGN